MHLALALYAASVTALAINLFNRKKGGKMADLLEVLQGLSTPLYVISRIIQIRLNYKNQATGELSPIPFAINFFGAVSRFATTLLELKGDPLLIFDYTVRMFLNVFMIYQIFYYSKKAALK
jgi:hypothetical protein